MWLQYIYYATFLLPSASLYVKLVPFCNELLFLMSLILCKLSWWNDKIWPLLYFSLNLFSQASSGQCAGYECPLQYLSRFLVSWLRRGLWVRRLPSHSGPRQFSLCQLHIGDGGSFGNGIQGTQHRPGDNIRSELCNSQALCQQDFYTAWSQTQIWQFCWWRRHTSKIWLELVEILHVN